MSDSRYPRHSSGAYGAVTGPLRKPYRKPEVQSVRATETAGLPVVIAMDGGRLGLTWTRGGLVFSLEVPPGFEWFFRNRASDAVEGGETAGPEFWKRLREVLESR